MELQISTETLCRLVLRARELEAQVPAIETDGEDDPEDSDDPYAVLEDEANAAIEAEFAALLDDCADDELAELLALTLIGRGTFDASEWDDALEEALAGDRDAIIAQLTDMPMLAACLEAGMAAFDIDCGDVGQIA